MSAINDIQYPIKKLKYEELKNQIRNNLRRGPSVLTRAGARGGDFVAVSETLLAAEGKAEEGSAGS